MTKTKLEEYRTLAEKHANKGSGRIVLELLDEIIRLRQLWTRNEAHRGQVSDETLMPFGEYKGERMVDVPEDYLLWWLKQNNREGLAVEAEFGPTPRNFVAKRKLKIYDYIRQRINAETDETAAELSEAEILELVHNNGFPDAAISEDAQEGGGGAHPFQGLQIAPAWRIRHPRRSVRPATTGDFTGIGHTPP